MSRIALTDGSGKWFSTETAEKFDEAGFHDGRNWISKATGSQTEHQALYRTAGGLFILNCWTDYQGVHETYEQIGEKAAAKWFAINGYDPHEDVVKEFNDLELK